MPAATGCSVGPLGPLILYPDPDRFVSVLIMEVSSTGDVYMEEALGQGVFGDDEHFMINLLVFI